VPDYIGYGMNTLTSAQKRATEGHGGNDLRRRPVEMTTNTPFQLAASFISVVARSGSAEVERLFMDRESFYAAQKQKAKSSRRKKLLRRALSKLCP
jgi:hypothetical protein